MGRRAVQALRSNAFWGWCILLIFMELFGYSLANGAARSADFRAFYAAGHIVRTDAGHLYSLGVQEQVQSAFVSRSQTVIPFYHPAYEALFYLPLSFLRYQTAYLVYIAVNILLLGIALLIAPFHSSFPLAKWSHAAAFFLFLPALFTILEGQDSIIFLVICCLVLRELRRGDELVAGLFLGLAVFRPQLAVPLAILLACRLGWRFLAGFASMAAPLTVLCGIMVKREGLAALYAMLGKASMVQDHTAAAQRAIAVYPQRMPNLYGLLYACAGRFMTPSRSFLLTGIASLVLFAVCVFVIRRSHSIANTFGVAALGTALLSYHLYAYDATILLLPILLLSGRIHFYLVIVCYVLPYVLFFGGQSGWFCIYATVPLALLFVAIARIISQHSERKRISGSGQPLAVIETGVAPELVSVRPSSTST